MVLFRKWYFLYMSDKNCGSEPKKKSGLPKNTLYMYRVGGYYGTPGNMGQAEIS